MWATKCVSRLAAESLSRWEWPWEWEFQRRSESMSVKEFGSR